MSAEFIIKELEGLAEDGAQLSIVMQGPLLKTNLNDCALICRHWRQLFSQAEIIFSVSSCDFLKSGNHISGLFPEDFVTTVAEFDTTKRNSLKVLFDCADIIVKSRDEIPLPPIKNDTNSLNNINLQIESARKGLEYVSRKYTLRIRSDLCFTSKKFIEIYKNNLFSPRGKYGVFSQKVLISETFTINPITLYKMPFHYSDWFHFGLSKDIKDLWECVRKISFPDSVYYQSNHFLKNTNLLEKRFLIRLACEQYIHFPYFKKSFPHLKLDYHNDTKFVKESLYIMADNFIVANLRDMNAYIKKYQHIVRKMSKHTRIECMSQAILDEIIEDPQNNIDKVFSKQTKISHDRMFWAHDRRTALFRRFIKKVNRFLAWYRSS
ncbi:WavE lipopolysaccharide synthesis family protein [Komagataeibacter sp. SM21]|uniref:WavE lipopolysaccharide synthesis family protein n=1 Tax=Komagataeibacter sp. SM21 TaxID=3242899 RepID=UPI0035273493